MRPPENFVATVGRIRYDVSKATLLAGDDYWDGRSSERNGRNTWLYCTPRGSFFTITRTKWEGEEDVLRPLSRSQAIRLWNTNLREHYVADIGACPDVPVDEA